MFEGITFISEWLNSGSYGFFTEAAAYWVKTATLAYFAFIEWMVPFAWGVAKSIINDLNLSSHLATAWGSMDSQALSIATFLKLPEVISNILTAGMAKIVMKFIPGM
ncbi:MAG: DUF2523 family protein [Candidatus Sedimenticola sp. (ex Thyasira tokunagai)]